MRRALLDEDGNALIDSSGNMLIIDDGVPEPIPPREPGNYVPLNTLHRTIVRKHR